LKGGFRELIRIVPDDAGDGDRQKIAMKRPGKSDRFFVM
jgi:hypothetical protein